MAEPAITGNTGTSEPTFEADLAELEKIVRTLESGEMSLEQSLQLFTRGVSLSEACRKRLEDAETRIEILLKKSNGNIVPQPFQEDKT